MVKIYFKRILAETMTINNVPPKWRAQVQEMIDAQEGVSENV